MVFDLCQNWSIKPMKSGFLKNKKWLKIQRFTPKLSVLAPYNANRRN